MTIRKTSLATALVSSLVFFVQCSSRAPIGGSGPDGGARGDASGSAGHEVAVEAGSGGFASANGGAAGTEAGGESGGAAGLPGVSGSSGGAGQLGTAGLPGVSGFSGEAGQSGMGGFTGAGGTGVSCPTPSSATNIFLAATAISLPNTVLATSLIVGDVNGDALADVIVGSRDLVPPDGSGSAGQNGAPGAGDDIPVSATVFLADKAKGLAPGVSYGGPIPYFLGLGDVNGDKQVDLVAADFYGPTIHLNQGGGALGAAATYDVSGDAGSFATGDLDGDGKAELLFPTSGPQGGLMVLKSAGGSSFSPKTYDAGFSPTVVAAGELDGVAGTDVVLAGPNGVHVLFSEDTAGNLVGPLTFGNPTSAIALVDIDGDSKLDIVATATGGATSVFLNLGDRQFAIARRLPLSGQAVFGDLDGDGKTDAVSVSCSTVALYLNDGHGSFSAPSTIETLPSTDYVLIALGDVNGDKALDLVMTTQTSVNVRVHRAP